MGLARTCTLAFDATVIFPDRCVWCGKGSPDNKHIYSAKQGLSLSGLSGWHRIEVPCCPGCEARITGGRVIRGAWSIAIVAAVSIPATWLFYHYTTLRDAMLGLAVFGVICVALFGIVVYEFLHPPRFSIDLVGSKLSFNFTDHDYAQEFAIKNGMSFERPPNASG